MWHTYTHTHRPTDRQSLLEDASRIKNGTVNWHMINVLRYLEKTYTKAIDKRVKIDHQWNKRSNLFVGIDEGCSNSERFGRWYRNVSLQKTFDFENELLLTLYRLGSELPCNNGHCIELIIKSKSTTQQLFKKKRCDCIKNVQLLGE